MELGGLLGDAGAFSKTSSPPPSRYATNPYGQCHLSPEEERRSMDWKCLSPEEKRYRIAKANRTKAYHSLWKRLWELNEKQEKRPPLEMAAYIWQYACDFEKELNNPDPEIRKKVASWLRKNHDICMDANGKMHFIKQKRQK